MRIKMLTIMATPARNAKAGDILDLPDGQAQELLQGGYAVAAPVTPAPTPATPKPVERAVVAAAPETAVLPETRAEPAAPPPAPSAEKDPGTPATSRARGKKK